MTAAPRGPAPRSRLAAGAVPAGLLGELAQGAAALRAHPAAIRLIGADIMCSFLYGAQTVLLLLVSRQVGLGAQGYGYMFAAIGAGGLAGTALAGRASRSCRSRPGAGRRAGRRRRCPRCCSRWSAGRPWPSS